MPAEKPKDEAQHPEPVVMSEREAQQERARRVAREAAQAEERDRPIDETVAGGRYLVGDQWVNADGEPLKDK